MVETAEAKQVSNAASTLLFPKLNLGVKQCGKYTREDFLEILSRIAFDQELSVSYKTPHALVVLSTISRRNAIKTPCTRCTVFRDS